LSQCRWHELPCWKYTTKTIFPKPLGIFVFPDYTDRSGDGEARSAVLVRSSHELLDAYSILNILASASGIKLPIRTSANTGRTRLVKYVNGFIKLVLAIPELFGFAYDTWDGGCFRLDDPGALVSCFSDPIPMSLIKGLKKKLGVSFGGR